MSLLLLFRSVASSSPPAVALREADDRLALSVTHADGSVTRWAGDEADAALVAGNLEFGSVVPGGFKDLTCELLRGLTPRADEGLFDDVRCYGAGNRTAWEGRMAQLPRTNTSLRPGAVGWSAHLDDDQSFQEIYVDSDVGNWGGMALDRKRDLVASYKVSDGSLLTSPTSGHPSVETLVEQPFAAAVAEAVYDGTWLGSIGSVYYAWEKANVNEADTSWDWRIATYQTDRLDSGSLVSSSVNLRAAGPGSGRLDVAPGARFAVLRFVYGAATTGTAQHRVWWGPVAVYGRHGLVSQAATATQPPGLLATDIVADVVRRGAPLLTVRTDSITPNAFALTHFPNVGPAPPSEWISRVNAYLLWQWAVWENRVFSFRPPADDVVWVARLSDGAQLDLEGDQAQDIINGVVVTFTDPNGRRRTVGPPGATANVTDASLADTDPTNPVNAHGIARRWAKLELSTVTTDQGAVQIGGVYLAEAKLAKRRGTLTVSGSVDRQGQPGRWPAWTIRAGDYVTVGDRAGEPLRRVIEARYSHATRTTTMTLDSSAQKLDAILERLNAALVGVLGG